MPKLLVLDISPPLPIFGILSGHRDRGRVARLRYRGSCQGRGHPIRESWSLVENIGQVTLMS